MHLPDRVATSNEQLRHPLGRHLRVSLPAREPSEPPSLLFLLPLPVSAAPCLFSPARTRTRNPHPHRQPRQQRETPSVFSRSRLRARSLVPRAPSPSSVSLRFHSRFRFRFRFAPWSLHVALSALLPSTLTFHPPPPQVPSAAQRAAQSKSLLTRSCSFRDPLANETLATSCNPVSKYIPALRIKSRRYGPLTRKRGTTTIPV
ncbi:hypothetical protein AK830_g4804 [Neonectria ditissima]|uniref:Uncharacterized protein n=1 Tax=Neonectria ditissima TaxID=78410 RepID=A0A0N8H7H3_9HYPO|nr:hypothetical protein AK830_g4804 [Neonectria ditissima]